jgi:hypothetical protein
LREDRDWLTAGEAGELCDLLDAYWNNLDQLPSQLNIAISLTGHGAFMEQSGRNQLQSVANGTAAKTARTSANRCRGLRPVA